MIDIVQTATLAILIVILVWALLMVRSAFTEGVRLLRESLDRLHALECRVNRLEKHPGDESPPGNP